MTDHIRLRPTTGDEAQRYIPELARLRITVFRDFPYLYDGDLSYEEKYLRTYVESPDSVIVVALDGERCVGASTAVPLKHETEEFKRPFVAAGYDPDDVFYLGESVLLSQYRGRGLGVRFFEEREAHARKVGDFAIMAFCAVERPEDHPMRPGGYQDLAQFWRNRGYTQHPELRTTYNWRDVGEAEATDKPMVFWLKQSNQ